MELPVTIQQIQACAPSTSAAIVEAIIRTESGINPLAINVNRGFKLARQPTTRKEAEAWARWLLANGYNFDAGLMQINSANWKKLELTSETVFDVCENIRAGAELFRKNYSRAVGVYGSGHTSLVSALSAYNTGDFTSGIHNGYVSKVVQNTRLGGSEEQEIPPLIPIDKSLGSTSNKRKKPKHTEENTSEPDPFASPTTVDSFTIEGLKSWGLDPGLDSTSGTEEPDAPNPKEAKYSDWRKKLSMKTKRLFVAMVLAASILTA